MLLKNKKILVGITGSIAAYKIILLVRLFIKAGAEVKVVMTEASKAFVSPLVLSVLSKNKVCIEWEVENEWNNHVELGRWPDIILIAPLSCNTLAKMANGFCDNLLLAVYLSATCPVVIAPAMDDDMWHHFTTKKNIAHLKEHGVSIIESVKGELASGLFGDGRMAEPEDIFTFLIEGYFREKQLKGKKVLITAGPTYEPIDPVRFIGNRSSGKMGFALAESFYLNGSDVILVTGPTTQTTQYRGITLVSVETAAEMFEACNSVEDADIIVMSAAVADYTPTQVADQKIKKTGEEMVLNLHHTKDILKYFGANKKQGQYIAGFALETDNEKENAVKKLKNKNLDCIVLNSLNDQGAGFGKDTNKITIINHEGMLALDVQSKAKVADSIVDYIITDMGIKKL
jgi:phosphopantothenoylcysteine decarboxylase/phosphopantothenate--cysteine ligase